MADDAPQADPQHILVDTGKGRIPLDDIGRTQKGMAHWMADIAPRISNCWHAAQGGNWELAGYYLRTAVKLMRHSVVLRPVYREDMETYIDEVCPPVTAAIKARDLDEFERTYRHLLDRANFFHGKWNFDYIRCTVPTRPPNVDLDFGPPPEA